MKLGKSRKKQHPRNKSFFIEAINKYGQIKSIGTEARKELEAFFDARVFLDLHVKVKESWRDDERALDSLGLPSPRKRRRS